MQMQNPDEIFKLIKEKTNKSEEEIKQEIQEIKDKYQGLLSDVGANIMVAKKNNVSLDLKSTSSTLKISDLNPNLDNVNIYARIKSINPIRTFKSKDGSKKEMGSIFLIDNDSSIKLNLWQEKVSILDDLEKNDLVFIKDAFVTEYKGRLETSLRYGGEIIKNPENPPEIKKLDVNYYDISNIKKTDELIDTVARVTNIFPENTFKSKDDRDRKVINFIISDGNKSIKVSAWDLHADFVKDNLSKGDIISLNDVSVKEGLYDIELNANFFSTIKKNPKTTKKIPPLNEIISKDIIEGKIGSLEENKYYKVNGVIVSVKRNNIRFFKCPECNEKIYLINDEFVCENCNKVVEPVVNMVANIEIDDSTGILKIVMFSSVAQKLYGIEKSTLKKELSEEEKLEIFDKLEDYLLGKKIEIVGKVRLNNFSSELEMIADSFEILEKKE